MRKSRLAVIARLMSELSTGSLNVFHHSMAGAAVLVTPPNWTVLQLAGAVDFGG